MGTVRTAEELPGLDTGGMSLLAGDTASLPPLGPVPQAGTLQLCLEPAVKTEQELQQKAWAMERVLGRFR